jgi:hypothetical protein
MARGNRFKFANAANADIEQTKELSASTRNAGPEFDYNPQEQPFTTRSCSSESRFSALWCQEPDSRVPLQWQPTPPWVTNPDG